MRKLLVTNYPQELRQWRLKDQQMCHLCQPKFRLRSCTQCNKTLADAMKSVFGLILFRSLQNHKILQPHRLTECYSCHRYLCSHSSNDATQPQVPAVHRKLKHCSSYKTSLFPVPFKGCTRCSSVEAAGDVSLSFSSVASLHFNCYRYFDRYSSGRGGGDSLPAQSGSTAQRYQTEECPGELRDVT